MNIAVVYCIVLASALTMLNCDQADDCFSLVNHGLHHSVINQVRKMQLYDQYQILHV